jgi:hypothetical protein
MLTARSHVEVTLEDRPEPAARIATVADERDWRQIFGPRTPEIRDLATTGDGGRLVLRWSSGDEPAGMTFNVLRDGEVIARDLPGTTTEFTDPMSADHPTVTRCYTVEAVFTVTGNTSQHAAPRCYWGPSGVRVRTFGARDFSLTGGRVVDSNGRVHTADWGDPAHRIEVGPFTAASAGEHLVQLVAANGSNGFTTGITCALKRVDVIDVANGMSVGGGYVALPQTGGWDAWRDSTFVRVRLMAGRIYHGSHHRRNAPEPLAARARPEPRAGGPDLATFPLTSPCRHGASATLCTPSMRKARPRPPWAKVGGSRMMASKVSPRRCRRGRAFRTSSFQKRWSFSSSWLRRKFSRPRSRATSW